MLALSRVSSTSSAPNRRLASTTRRSCSACSRSASRAPLGLRLPHLVLQPRVAVPEEGRGEGERGARVAADHERPHDLAGVVVRPDDRRDDGRDEREDQQLQRPRAVQVRVPVPLLGLSRRPAIVAESSAVARSAHQLTPAYAATRPEPEAARKGRARSPRPAGSARPAAHSAAKRSSPSARAAAG